MTKNKFINNSGSTGSTGSAILKFIVLVGLILGVCAFVMVLTRKCKCKDNFKSSEVQREEESCRASKQPTDDQCAPDSTRRRGPEMILDVENGCDQEAAFNAALQVCKGRCNPVSCDCTWTQDGAICKQGVFVDGKAVRQTLFFQPGVISETILVGSTLRAYLYNQSLYINAKVISVTSRDDDGIMMVVQFLSTPSPSTTDAFYADYPFPYTITFNLNTDTSFDVDHKFAAADITDTYYLPLTDNTSPKTMSMQIGGGGDGGGGQWGGNEDKGACVNCTKYCADKPRRNPEAAGKTCCLQECPQGTHACYTDPDDACYTLCQKRCLKNGQPRDPDE